MGGVTYRHRSDFAETAHISGGGSVSASLVVVREGEEIHPDMLRDKVVLIPERPGGFDLSGTVAAATEWDVAVLLVEWGEPTWFHKTVHGGAANRIPVLRIRESLATTLSTQTGVKVEIDLPLRTEPLRCRNLLGLWPGAVSTHTVALTAHYDHLRDDPSGERFPGALDNASGVVTMLAVAESLV